MHAPIVPSATNADGAEREERFVKIALVGLICLFILSAYTLGYAQRDLDPDELFSLQAVEKSLRGMSRDATILYPPLYFFSLKLWVSIVGSSVFSTRLLSLLFAIWAILLTYRLAAELYTNREALWAAVLLTISNFHLFYATEIRMYSMVMALSLLSTRWFFRSFVQQREKGGRFNYAVVTLLLAWTHHFTWFLIGSHGLYLLLRGGKDRGSSLRAWLKIILLLMVLQLPWVILLARHWAYSYTVFASDVQGLQSHGAHSLSGVVYLIGAFNGMLPIQNSMRYSFILWGVPFFVVLWHKRAFSIHSISSLGREVVRAELGVPTGYFLLAMTVPITILTTLSSIITPLFIPRYLIYCLPVYYLIVSRCAVLSSPKLHGQLLILLPALLWSIASAASLRLFL